MATYIVTYDLRKEEDSDDYKALGDALKRLNGHKYQLSAWLIDTTMTAKQVVEHLSNYLDKNDRIWVSDFTTGHWFNNALKGTNDWIKKHPPKKCL